MALAAASCSKDPGADAFGISVNLPESEIEKTVLSAPDAQNKYQLFWQNGDKISVNGTVSNALSGASGTSTTADFTFASAPATASIYNFLYPGTTSSDVVNFPAVQNYAAASADGAAMPMYAVATSLADPVNMSNLSAIVRFSVKGTAVIDRIVLKSKGGEPLSGNFTVGKTSGKLNGTLSSTSTVDSVVLNCNALQLSATDANFFVSVPVQNYSEGIEAKVFDNEGGAMRLTFWGSGKTPSAQSVYHFESKTFVPYYAWVIADDGSMTAESVTCDQTTKIKVCTFNIWGPSSRQSAAVGSDYDQLQWNKAYKAVVACINANDPDVIGLNEMTWANYDTGTSTSLRNNLSGYTWVIFASQYWPATDPDNISNPSSNMGTTNAILFKTDKFTKESSTMCWLTSADEARGKTVTYYVPKTDTLYTKHHYNDDFEVVPGGKYQAYTSSRVVCCAKLKHKASGKSFWVFSAHQDLTSFNGPATTAQPTGYRTIKDWGAQCTNSRSLICHARRLCPEGTPSIIMGDMNADNNQSYTYYLNSGAWYAAYDADHNWVAKELAPTPGRWTDCYEAVAKRDGTVSSSAVTGTMNNKDNYGYNTWRPDHILEDGFTIISYGVDKNKYNNSNNYPIFPSDHFLVRAVLAF